MKQFLSIATGWFAHNIVKIYKLFYRYIQFPFSSVNNWNMYLFFIQTID